MNQRFIIKGINDDENFCACCGKQGLKKVVWIEDTETGALEHFGVICALKPSKAFGIVKDDMKAHERSWKGIERQSWIMARKAYRHAGGIWRTIYDDKGRMDHTEAEDLILWEQCKVEGMKRVRAALAA